MTKILDLIVFATMFFGIAGLSQSKSDKLTFNVEVIDSCIVNPIDSICISVVDTVNETITQVCKDTIEYKREPKEWYAFEGSKFKYNYKPIPYTEKELNLFTNVLYRESGMGFTVNQEVNKYFVAIVGVMRIICENDKFKTISDMIKYSNSFTYPEYGTRMPYDSIKRPNEYKAWMHCKNVVKNVLEANIPSYVPYIPYGTFCYWSDEIDTNMQQKRYLEERGICIATSVWNSHYYLIEKYAKPEELQYLVDNDLLCNPVPKKIGNGKLCSNKFLASSN
jgi:hypothetical protein